MEDQYKDGIKKNPLWKHVIYILVKELKFIDMHVSRSVINGYIHVDTEHFRITGTGILALCSFIAFCLYFIFK